MSAVNESVVREYFESLGFLSTQPRKQGGAGKRAADAVDVDLLFANPMARVHRIPEGMVLTTEDLRQIQRAVVGIRGGHADRFYAHHIDGEPELLAFAGPRGEQAAVARLGPGPVARILCVPRLPASDDLREKLLTMLRARGVDGVLTFQSMLAELIATIDMAQSYEKSDLLEVLRMLKCYDLVHNGQLELFRAPRRRRPGATAAPTAQAERPMTPDQSQSV